MPQDFILNGQAHGSVAARLLANGFDARSLRPYAVGESGYERSYIDVTRNVGGEQKEVAIPTNNLATLRKDEWRVMDEAVLRVAKPRLRAFGDLRSAGLQMVIPNGFGKTVLEYEDQSDVTPATISMDGLRRSESDRPVYDLKTIPLPITHKDFHISARQLEASRNGSTPFDTTMAELSARRVAEEVEKLTLGTRDEYFYGGGSVYGYTNFPGRLTGDLTDPETGGWTGADLVREIIQMREQSVANFHYGPWRLYNSPEWDVYLDEDYSDQKGDNTLRDRIQAIRGISSVDTLDYLEGLQMILVEQSTDTVRAVVGMDMTTLQWETHGGMEINFKIMAILLIQLRSDQNGNTGIVHREVPAGTGS